jgi:hypothetical protein
MMWRNRTRDIAPNEECIARGTKRFCQIDRTVAIRNLWLRPRSGTVYDELGMIRWRYAFRRNPSGWGSGNPFNKPDFVIADPDAKDEVIIRRVSFIPPVFSIRQAERSIGRIRMRSWFNKYSIEIEGEGSWVFRMPLFSTRFYGVSSAGPEIWVVVGPSKMEWNILLKPGVKEWPLLAALAFIHDECWHYA